MKNDGFVHRSVQDCRLSYLQTIFGKKRLLLIEAIHGIDRNRQNCVLLGSDILFCYSLTGIRIGLFQKNAP